MVERNTEKDIIFSIAGHAPTLTSTLWPLNLFNWSLS